MSTATNDIKGITIGELFSSDEVYRIPLYQRNFAWGRPEIKQMIRDVADFAVKKDQRNYYLGILVVYKRINGEEQFEVVDGQQRLTILSLIMRAFKNKELQSNGDLSDINIDLNFAHRPKAQNTLRAISKNNLEELDEQKSHSEIESVYKELPSIVNEVLRAAECSVDQFYNYLNNHVILYRSPLPDDTELNHYFEVMNNRGEQLEKHEVLKAKLMSTVNEQGSEQKNEIRNTIHHVWEACSDMNRYVQYGFPKKLRNELFGKEWNDQKNWLKREDFSRLSKILEKASNKDGEIGKTISDIIRGDKPEYHELEVDDKNPDRFQSVINFQNFLIQVLRLYQHQYDRPQEIKDYASLDDKVLLDEFEPYWDNLDFVKRFTLLLLKVRFLFDQYVIKRKYEGENDEWSLLKLKYYPKEGDRKQESTGYVNTFGGDNDGSESQNHHVLILLSMFHVSTPTQNYKHWLTAVLSYLVNQENVSAAEYIHYLENLARKLFFDRFMIEVPDEQIAYENIVFLNTDELRPLKNPKVNEKLLRYQEVRNNLVFNYLDYLIWKEKKEKNDRVKKFDFRFRSSVEHFNPRNPKEHQRLEPEVLNSFGNLCLIAHGKNSSFGNNSPLSKAYNESEETPIDSLKLYVMMEMAKENIRNQKGAKGRFGGWGPEEVKNHQRAMIEKFKNSL